MSLIKNESKFSKEIESLVRYVKDHMKSEDDWVVIKYRDVPKITGISSYYVRKLFELLKDHKNIVFEIDKQAKTHKKPLKFRFVDEETKLNTTLTEKNFYYLNQDEVDYIRARVGDKDIRSMSRILGMCNLLASMDAREKFIPLDIKLLTDTLVSSKKATEEVLDILRRKEILIDRDGMAKLILNSADLQSVKAELNQSAPVSKNNLNLDTGKLLDKLLEKQSAQVQSVDEQEDDLKESNSLVENMRSFRNAISAMQDDFRAFIDKEIERVSESDKKDKELDQGFETLQRLMDENNRLIERNKHLESENERLVKSLEKAQKFRDQFIINAEQRLEVLLAEVIGVVSNYAQIPGWQKDQVANAKLQKNILSAVTSAVDDMLQFTKE
ncbi:hypothetical protein [Heyndrickxia sporothermodurans]|uniref:hypothetical protein n=1 Tax=Heyndrickxia sporothermodurans TaxID=46224 RepID=UPI000D377E4F|nr:hypothetical protein [Heyndrickxia sporothermodurans]PTY93003.1 hypothetical protein B5V90_02670 [Heyndrickxia sporothermodurans]